MTKSRSQKAIKPNVIGNKLFSKVSYKARNIAVQVVECPSDFPNTVRRPKDEERKSHVNDDQDDANDDFNFANAHDEIYKLGMNTGKEEKQRLKEKEYKFLTGRAMKRKALPFREYLKSLDEKKKMDRDRMEDIKSSGVVVGKSTIGSVKKEHLSQKGKKPKFSKENKKNNRLFGPAPSIGYMSGGVLRIKKT